MSVLDKILGKKQLKQRIKTLERSVKNLRKEKQELKKDAKEQRRRAKKAVTEKQKVYEKLNRAKDKINSLKGKVNQQTKRTERSLKKRRINKKNLEQIVEKLKTVQSSEEDLYSIYLKKNSSISLNKTEDLELNMLRRVNNLKSKTGKILFSDKNSIVKVLIKPPFPVKSEVWKKSDKFYLEDLEKILKIKEFGLIFLSSGGSSLAKINEKISNFKFIKSGVKSKHSKGGFSQQRFERNREKSVKKHLETVNEILKNFFEEDINYIIISGVHSLVKKFRKEFKLDFGGIVFERSLNFSKIEDKKKLKRSLKNIWKSEIIKI